MARSLTKEIIALSWLGYLCNHQVFSFFTFLYLNFTFKTKNLHISIFLTKNIKTDLKYEIYKDFMQKFRK